MRPDYRRSIVNLTSSLLKHFDLETYHPSLSALDEVLKRDYKHILLVVLDGMGENILDAHLKQEDLLKQARKSTLTSVFPATTTAATTSLMSGKTPYEHGFLGWNQFFKNEDIHYEIFMGTDFYDKDKEIPKDFHKKHFEYKSALESIKEKHPSLCVKAFQPTPVDEKGHETFKEGVDRYLSMQRDAPRSFAYLYSQAPDLHAHEYGTESIEVNRGMRTLNNELTRLRHTMDDDTLVVVTADHGLIDIVEIPLFEFHDLTSTFEHLPANEPRMTNFFIKDTHREHFINFFNEHFSKYFNLYTKNELLSKKLLGHGEKHPHVDECLGDFIAVAKSKYMFKLSDDKSHKAHHAGITDAEMRVPLIFFDKEAS